MSKWEYLYVAVERTSGLISSSGYQGYHPRHTNGRELQGWKGMTLHDYSNWLGQQGWELVSTISSDAPDSYPSLIIFKRQLP